jgi:MSHA biogenesis protein MshQ
MPCLIAVFRSMFRCVLFSTLLALAAPAVLAATYTFRSDSYSWESTTTTLSWDRLCTSFPGDDDQATITFTGGFTFSFAGTAYSSVRVLANGSLQFGADTGFFRTYTNTTLPAGVPRASGACANTNTARALVVYWTDLNPSAAGSGGVTWQQKGTAPNRYVVVSWNAVYQYNTSTPYTFQVILYENGEFKYQYGNANATGSNATIGVQVSDSDYTLYAYNSGYNANGTAIRWSVASATATRLADYRFDEFTYNGTIGEVRDSSGNAHHGVRVGTEATTASGYICRGLSIPANVNSTALAVDTQVPPGAIIGNSGSLSFFVSSNVSWTSATAAMLMDATSSSTRPFYLMRNGGGALRFVVTDSAGTTLIATTAANSTGAGTWVHVAATWRLAAGSNQSTVRIYIDGALAATTTGTTNGTLEPSLPSLYAGDARGTGTPAGATTNSANGTLDELRLYNFEIGVAEIALDRANAHSCAPPVDHYELSLPTSGISCLASTVTVTACSDSGSPCSNRASSVNGTTAALAASGLATVTPLVTFDSTGQATATLSHPTAADGTVVSVTLSGEQTAASFPRQCCPNGASCAAANSCSITFNTAGFVVASAANGASTTVPAQTAGTGSAGYFLRAVQSNTSTGTCTAALTGSNTVDWAYQCNNPTTCSSGNRVTLTANAAGTIAANPNTGVSSTTSVAMTFDGSGNAPFSFKHSDVGQITLVAGKAASGSLLSALSGRSNAFVVKPAGFVLSGIRCSSYVAGQCATSAIATPGSNPAAASASGTAFLPAGASFSATVTAVNSSGVATPNYGRETTPEGVKLTANLVAPSGGNAATLTNPTAFGSFTAGVASGSTFQWGEVGIITLTPSVGDGDYLGAGDVTGTTSGNVGRFYPANFALSAGSATHRANLSCAPASTFSYLGENFRLAVTLTARNAGGGTTLNYGGSFAKFDPTAASAWNLAGVSGSTVFTTASTRLSLGAATGSWSSGVLTGATITAAALRASTPDGPFNASFGVAPTDSDGVALASFDLASVPSGSADRGTVATLPLRFGRLRLSNATGAADRPLALPASAQYWDGSSFVIHTLDSCTTVPASAVNFGNLRRTLTTADTAVSSPIALSSGLGSLKLAAPGGGRSGTADIALSLGSSATDVSCLQTWTPAAGDAATAGANLAFLRGAWCSASYAQDPSARATFGRQRDPGQTVYRRENF